jgi:hypothetical protein
MAKHASTETIGRCRIEERTVQIDGKGHKRWVVTWRANDTSRPVEIICDIHHAAYVLVYALNADGVLWPF